LLPLDTAILFTFLIPEIEITSVHIGAKNVVRYINIGLKGLFISFFNNFTHMPFSGLKLLL